MGRVSVAVTVLLVCSSFVTAVDSAVPLTLKSMKRTLPPDKGSYIFTVDFTSPVQITATVFIATGKIPGVVTYNEITGEGTAQMTVPRSQVDQYSGVYLSLGDIPNHYFDFALNVGGEEEEIVLDLDLPGATLIPDAADIAYTPGQITSKVFVAPNTRGQSITCEHRPDPLIGVFYDTNKGKIIEEWVPYFMEEFIIDTGDVTSTSYNFLTDTFEVNGIFQTSIHCQITSESVLPVYSLFMEEVIFNVHDASYSGPFPDDAVTATFESTDGVHRCSSKDRYCYLKCHAYANNLASAAVYRVESDGSRTLIASSDRVKRHAVLVFTDLTRTDTLAGQYVCVATQNNGGPSGEDTVTVEVVNAARVDSFRYETVGKGATVVLTCEGSGSNGLLVQLLKYDDQLEEGKNGVESYTMGVSIHGDLLRPQPA